MFVVELEWGKVRGWIRESWSLWGYTPFLSQAHRFKTEIAAQQAAHVILGNHLDCQATVVELMEDGVT
jgi:hypothetical protein